MQDLVDTEQQQVGDIHYHLSPVLRVLLRDSYQQLCVHN